MAQLTPNKFSSYEMLPEEEEAGSILSGLQRMVLSNKQAIIAQEKLNIVLTPENLADFQMQHAYKQAQLDLIDYLFDLSDSTELLIKERQAQNNSPE